MAAYSVTTAPERAEEVITELRNRRREDPKPFCGPLGDDSKRVSSHSLWDSTTGWPLFCGLLRRGHAVSRDGQEFRVSVQVNADQSLQVFGPAHPKRRDPGVHLFQQILRHRERARLTPGLVHCH
jgi:hypothetical protein